MAALCWTSGSMTSPSMTGSESPYVIRDGWPSSYSEDNEPLALPAAIADVFRRSTSRTCFWEIQLTPTIEANCHFFTEDEIEFDLDPREILSASDFDAVCAFVQAVGRALRRPVHVCQEGDMLAKGRWTSAIAKAGDEALGLLWAGRSPDSG
jgi:hypothetical protein